MNTKLKTAVWLALGTAVISGTNNFLTKFAVTVIPNPTVFTFLKNAIVGLFLIGLILLFARYKEIRQLQKNDWLKLAGIGIVGGGIPFILYFTGLTMTTAVSAAIIHKTLFIWVALLAVPILKERVGWIQGAAFVLLIAGNFVLGGLHSLAFGTGEMMILAATLLWAGENILAKHTLKNISSLTVAGARMVFGSVIIFIVVLFQGKTSLLTGLNGEQWFWTLLPSVLLLGYVVTWYTALKHAPATLVASILVPATFITSFLQMIFIDQAMNPETLVTGVLYALAIALLVWQSLKVSSNATADAERAHA
ncbi:MAG: DMT family transporter [bacterium]|nr:DMT family transporter [bacterium]